MSINNEKLKCKEIKEFNKMDSRPFSNYAIEVYEKSLENKPIKLKKKK